MLDILNKNKLTEEERKAREIKKAYSNKNRSHRYVKIVVGLFIGTYATFFLSNYYLPDSVDAYSIALDTVYDVDANHQISFIRSDFCKNEEKVELEIDLMQINFANGNYSVSATQGSTSLPIDIVRNTETNLILQIKDVSENKDIDFVIGYQNADEDLKSINITFSPSTLKACDTLPVKSDKEYQLQRLSLNIDKYQNRINEINNKIKENEETIQSITTTNADLEESKALMSEEEKMKIDAQIQSNNNASSELQKEIDNLRVEIIEVQNNLEQTKQNFETLKNEP